MNDFVAYILWQIVSSYQTVASERRYLGGAAVAPAFLEIKTPGWRDLIPVGLARANDTRIGRLMLGEIARLQGRLP